jgi:DNA-binding transcriptional ArsR family regulator
MEERTARKYQGRARVIKALAHPSRLLIVDTLAEGEHCVNELTTLIGADMSTVSKHLSVLKSAGVVQDEKRGSSIYYSLRIPCILNFVKCADAVIDAIRREEHLLEAHGATGAAE